jgi:GrpB-like predicted nucleotidyltransferase (UPF0157 family)
MSQYPGFNRPRRPDSHLRCWTRPFRRRGASGRELTWCRERQLRAVLVRPFDDEFVGPSLPLDHIAVVDPDPRWVSQFDALASRIRSTLARRVLDLQHIGSTSVADLPAKAIIDIVLVVEDSSDEAAYVPALERIGFALALCEPNWHRHRASWRPSPPAILHVWSRDSPGAIRHLMFRDWLRTHPDDRHCYAEAKRSAAAASNALDEDGIRV